MGKFEINMNFRRGSVATATTLTQESMQRLPVYEAKGEWKTLNWFVEDCASAWSCALDIDAWLRIRYAGNGCVEQVSGETGEIGVGFLHNHADGGGSDGRFELYYLTEIDDANMQLTFEVQTDVSAFRTHCPKKTCILRIDDTPRPSRTFHVSLRENGHSSAGYKRTGGPFLRTLDKNRNDAAGMALKQHFRRYTQRDQAIATATPIPEY